MNDEKELKMDLNSFKEKNCLINLFSIEIKKSQLITIFCCLNLLFSYFDLCILFVLKKNLILNLIIFSESLVMAFLMIYKNFSINMNILYNEIAIFLIFQIELYFLKFSN